MIRFLFLVFFLLASCGDDSVEGCVTRADCPDDQVCINGGCARDADAGPDPEDGAVPDTEASDAGAGDVPAPDAADSAVENCVVSGCGMGLSCDAASGSCVECLVTSDCASGTCTDGVCMACGDSSECTDPAAPACDSAAGVCGACTNDAECTGLSEGGAPVSAPICNGGICVECTELNTASCGDNSCDPASNRCTTTPRLSLQPCEACVSDGECMNGGCVEMMFMDAVHGSYCLLDESDGGCERGFRNLLNATSVSGVSSEYCGINEFTTCEALLSIGDPCFTDDECELGGLCDAFGDNACTIRCEASRDCPGEVGGSCDGRFCRPR